jgi:hypothetical protein
MIPHSTITSNDNMNIKLASNENECRGTDTEDDALLSLMDGADGASYIKMILFNNGT